MEAFGMAHRQSCQLPLADPISQTQGDWWGSDVKHHPLRCCLAFAHPPETTTHLLPSPVPYWETARGSVQSCYTARCSLTFPTRLLCAKHLDGRLGSVGGAMATGAQSTIYTTLISQLSSPFPLRSGCTAAAFIVSP